MLKIFISVITGLLVFLAAVRLRTWILSLQPVVLTGAVLRDDRDPQKQSPILNAVVMRVEGSSSEVTKSDSSGLFRLTIETGWLPTRPITLRFEHAEYQPLEITADDKNRIYVVRLEPLTREAVMERTDGQDKSREIKNVRVRYSLKAETTLTVGSLAKQFEVRNTGNEPCKGHPPCSPDGKWKASMTALPLDARKGDELRNVRVSCIAGPCPFTRLETGDLSQPAQKIEIKAIDWSDTASFLVEAEVTRTMVTDKTLQSYPFITGYTMSFALPAASEGPSIVADLSNQEIVFPLGPKLILSWASCSVEPGAGGNKIYRCELKPGYHFLQ